MKSVCVIVKHVEHIGIIRAFLCLGRLAKVLSAWRGGGGGRGGQKNCWVVVC